MPTQTFSSFEAFFDANRHADLRAMVLGPDRGNWLLTNLTVGKLSVQFGQAGGSAVVEGSPQPGGVSLFILTQGLLAMSGNGRRFDGLSVLVAGPGDEFCLAAEGWRRWCSLYIPNVELADAKENEPMTSCSKHGIVRLPSEQMERFRSIIRQLEQTVQRAPLAFQSAAAQKAARDKLVPEIQAVFVGPYETESTLGRRAVSRTQIIRASMDFLDEHGGDYLSVQQLATAAGVSERTLRDAFRHYFGVAPVEYLNRRTLHQVRKALQVADPSKKTVTEIAAEFGVWQLGRFAGDYRFLFGELPSETLRRSY